MKRSVLALLSVAVGVAIVDAATTSMYKLAIGDASANYNYPEGSLEYHCFDISGGVKTYVRGTYGYYGYFEGMADASNPLMFHVSWWDVLTSSSTLVPESGSAMLMYDATFSSVSGPYWAAGTSDMLNSYGTWSASHGNLTADDSTASGQAMILQKCLYPGATTAVTRANSPTLTNPMAISATSGQGAITFCSMPAGPAVSPFLATYEYIYGDDDGGGDEQGNQGTNPITFWGATSMGLAALWKASTGSYAGTQGTTIFTIVASTTGTYIVGFYCNVNPTTMVRTKCFTESYTVQGVNQNTDNCPYQYQLDSSLDPLYDFASVGSALSGSDNQDSSKATAIAMAILFGCLFGITMIALVMRWSMQRPAPMATKSYAGNAQL